jgi:hypothetical protein
LVRAFSSLPEFDIETQLMFHRFNLIANMGRIRLGRGDAGIAPSIPHMLRKLGIVEIDIRMRDRASFVEPPYESAAQKRTIENMKKHLLSDEAYRFHTEKFRDEFLAGGGKIDDYNAVLKLGEKQCKIQLEQINNDEFYICGAYPLYIIKGNKPK